MRLPVPLLLLALFIASPARAADVSTVIFPPQRMPLTFSHQLHLDKKIACDFCHEKAPTSHAASDDLIPTEESCTLCHEIDRAHPERTAKPVTACAACHPGFVVGKEIERPVVPKPELRFDHQIHVARDIPCTRCHTGMDKVTLAGRAQLPDMALCLSCHDSGRGALHAPSRCSTCHLVKADGKLETEFSSGVLRPSGTLRGDAHTLDFKLHHAAVAQNDEGYCLNCHRRDECLSCHNGVVKPFDFHGNDYVDRHAVEARRNDPNCSSCHRSQSFCLGCHERLGVVDVRSGPDGAFVPIGPKHFHPPGWADPSAAGDPNHHAWQALRNLRQCVSCHREETCLQCHASRTGAGQMGKMQVNPHPIGWAGSDRCRALAHRNFRVCMQCHGPTDPQLARCR